MKIPYNGWELRLALLGLDEKKFDKDKMKEMKDVIESVLSKEEVKDLNKRIAEFHGISVEQLINSLNYKVLCSEFVESALRKVAETIMKKFDIAEKEAWALMALGLGLLD